ncbi:hypothetical protein BDN67DRAFT_981594 [Paxillus ammoniavirescens]|nr:hypothetical protein BDN67DRAFT_981594 [Paxillus ammoniavirescens]
MPDGPVAAHIASNASHQRGLSSNYTILQQGFKVDVLYGTAFIQGLPLSSAKCLFADVGSVSVSNATPGVTAQVQWMAILLDSELFVIPVILIRSADGSYELPDHICAVCEATPLITNVQVEYNGIVLNVSDVVDKRALDPDGSSWPLLAGPAQTLALKIICVYYGVLGHVTGIMHITTMGREYSGSTRPLAFAPISIIKWRFSRASSFKLQGSGRDLIDYQSLKVNLGMREDGMAVLMAEDYGEIDKGKAALESFEDP